jgi:hypothetical protein
MELKDLMPEVRFNV